MAKIERVADTRCECGEGPLWHPKEDAVYWVDIPKGCLFRYDPAEDAHERVLDVEEAIGGFTMQADGALLLFMARGAVKRWDGARLETVLEEIPEERETRFNDVIADPAGRVFCGTMAAGERPGRLYRLDPDKTLTKVLDGIGCSNGMGFTLDRKRMYYTDSTVRKIYLFDYDAETGALTNQRLFVETPENEGVPDGMTVDTEGCVWTARWGGGCVVRYRADGKEDRRIEVPARKASSVTFGGGDYTDMYITTAGGDDRQANGPGAGALFRVRAGAQGMPEFQSRIGI